MTILHPYKRAFATSSDAAECAADLIECAIPFHYESDNQNKEGVHVFTVEEDDRDTLDSNADTL